MIEIIPAILPKTFEELEGQLSQIRGVVRSVQIDIVDGIFVPNKTWPYGSGDNLALPFAGEFDFEMDLMVAEPEDTAEKWRQASAKRIIIHADAHGAREALLALRFEREEHKKPEGIKVGIALPCSATPDVLSEFENLYDFVQVMGIEKVGFQGQPFDPRAVELLHQLDEQFPGLALQVDGAVSEEHIPELVRAGATRLVAGSAIWKSNDPKEEFRRLQSTVNSSQ